MPLGNTIYVTPNYFTRQNIPLTTEVEQQLAQLKEGQFGLLLPNKLKKESAEYQKEYEHYMAMYGVEENGGDSKKLFDVSAVASYLPDNQKRFIYNHTAISSKQYLVDPIIVVVTPKSLGNTFSARMFWMNNINDNLFFSSYDTALQHLKEQGLYHSISTISNSRQLYYEETSKLRSELLTMITGAILGMLTSILLFNSMNLLYFEEFRRDIFVKRMAGMRFGEVHQPYIMMQLIVLLAGFCVTVFFSKNLWTSLVTLAIFVGNALLILYWQMRSENKMAISILKGK